MMSVTASFTKTPTARNSSGKKYQPVAKTVIAKKTFFIIKDS